MRSRTPCILQIEFGITPRVLPVVSQPHQLLEEWEEGPGKDKLRKASMLRILLLPSGGFSLVQFSSGFVPWDSDKDDKDLHFCTYLHRYVPFHVNPRSTHFTLQQQQCTHYRININLLVLLGDGASSPAPVPLHTIQRRRFGRKEETMQCKGVHRN